MPTRKIYMSAIVKITRVCRRVKFTCVNEIQAMYERSRANVKVGRGSTFTYVYSVRATVHTLSLFSLRT